MTPRVSVLLPVRDGAPRLEGALASLGRQTFSDFEVVVVDDGSTDATPEILDRWARGEPRIRTIRREPAGIVAALERARAEARGELLARMDADDEALPDRLERQVALMDERADLVACGARVEYVPREDLTDGALRYEAWVNGLVEPDAIERDLFVECPLPHPTFVLRAEAVDAAGGYRDAGWPEDYDLLLRLWERGGRLGKAPDVLLRWWNGPDRLSRTHPAYSLDAFRRCKVHFLRRTLLQGRSGVVLWGAGPTGKAFSRVLPEAGVPLRAWVEVDPRKVGQKIHGAPVVDREGASGYPDALHLGTVAQPGARDEIRGVLTGLGLVEMEDFAMVA